jgi:hypothetical protein
MIQRTQPLREILNGYILTIKELDKGKLIEI